MGTASSDARSAFHRELQATTRSTSIAAGWLILVAFLGWALIDRTLEPAVANEFLVVRLVAETGVAVALALIVLRRVRGLGLEWASFAMFLIVQLAIAWMIPRVEQSFEAYLLGFSLALYGAGIVVAWRWPFTLLLAVVSVAALMGFELTEPSTMNPGEATIAGFYLGTASLVAVIAQYLRYQGARREFTMRRALEEEQRVSDLLVKDLARLSRQDELTGLANRRGWQERLEVEFASCRRGGGQFAVVLFDLDHFKRVNDERGHAAGDQVLREVGTLLAGVVRTTDVPARLGGDEFGVICPRADTDVVVSVAVRLVEAARGRARDLEPVGVTFSVGAAVLSADDADADAIVRRADEELYRAKETRDAAWVAGLRCDVPRETTARIGAHATPREAAASDNATKDR